MKPNYSQHDLSSVIHELHWIQLTVVVVYLEVISIVFMVMGVKRQTCNFSCVSKGLWNSARKLPALFICLPASFEVVSHRSRLLEELISF